MKIDEKRLKEILEENSLYKNILNRLYIARNVTLSEQEIQSCFKDVDSLFREVNHN